MSRQSINAQPWLLLAVAILAAICIGTIAVMTAPGPSF